MFCSRNHLRLSASREWKTHNNCTTLTRSQWLATVPRTKWMHAKFALFRRRRRRHQIVSFLSLLLQPIFVRVIRISHVSLTSEKPFARLEFNRKKLPNELLMKIAEITLCKHVGLASKHSELIIKRRWPAERKSSTFGRISKAETRRSDQISLFWLIKCETIHTECDGLINSYFVVAGTSRHRFGNLSIHFTMQFSVDVV